MEVEKRNQFGLTKRDMESISNILKNYPEIETVHLFGSRAKGNYKPGSDIDLAIMNNLEDNQVITKLSSSFDESLLPYKVDVINYYDLKQKELKEHIDRVGMLFYSSK